MDSKVDNITDLITYKIYDYYEAYNFLTDKKSQSETSDKGKKKAKLGCCNPFEGRQIWKKRPPKFKIVKLFDQTQNTAFYAEILHLEQGDGQFFLARKETQFIGPV